MSSGVPAPLPDMSAAAPNSSALQPTLTSSASASGVSIGASTVVGVSSVSTSASSSVGASWTSSFFRSSLFRLIDRPLPLWSFFSLLSLWTLCVHVISSYSHHRQTAPYRSLLSQFNFHSSFAFFHRFFQRIFEEFDVDGDDVVEINEAKAIVKRCVEALAKNEEKVLEAFIHFVCGIAMDPATSSASSAAAAAASSSSSSSSSSAAISYDVISNLSNAFQSVLDDFDSHFQCVLAHLEMCQHLEFDDERKSVTPLNTNGNIPLASSSSNSAPRKARRIDGVSRHDLAILTSQFLQQQLIQQLHLLAK